MGFISTITRRMSFEDRLLNYGTYTSSDAGTGGDVDTGLKRVDFMILQPKGSSLGNAPQIDESMPCDNGKAVTIKTVSNETGEWVAVGT